ncbi:TorD/DmsD family molecular chaperone [Shewanella marisflavi]|uniref:Molecular chaperone TorD n=1 Tax=Shewanella marisflavi TaxID=260364 RepID=A0AAC9XM89_9GAMM|nr:molecular chaperone TorD family protein [Shewanella marisflavi]ASJ95304.1 molecular chaperone TorD [Shewanella marisflavi]
MTTFKSTNELRELQAISRVLHHSFIDYPTKDTITFFIENDIAQSWPTFTHSTQNKQGKQLLTEYISQWDDTKLIELKLDYGQLFFGPGEPKAMPWGSVYLGEQGIINDDSTIQLMNFYQKIQVSFNVKDNQPVDHIALFYAVIDQLIEQMLDGDNKNANEAKDALFVILQHHLLPWSNRCLTLAESNACTNFYKGLALLAQDFETQLSQILNIVPIQTRLFR